MARGAHGAFVDGGYMYIFGGICVDEVQAPTCAPAHLQSYLKTAAVVRQVGACWFLLHQLPHEPVHSGCMVSTFCWQLLALVALPMAGLGGLHLQGRPAVLLVQLTLACVCLPPRVHAMMHTTNVRNKSMYQRRVLGDLWRFHLTEHTWEPVFTCGNLPGPRHAFGARPSACAQCAALLLQRLSLNLAFAAPYLLGCLAETRCCR